jgi:hypothetical protein
LDVAPSTHPSRLVFEHVGELRALTTGAVVLAGVAALFAIAVPVTVLRGPNPAGPWLVLGLEVALLATLSNCLSVFALRRPTGWERGAAGMAFIAAAVAPCTGPAGWMIGGAIVIAGVSASLRGVLRATWAPRLMRWGMAISCSAVVEAAGILAWKVVDGRALGVADSILLTWGWVTLLVFCVWLCAVAWRIVGVVFEARRFNAGRV